MRPTALGPILSVLGAVTGLVHCGGSTTTTHDATADATAPAPDAASDRGQQRLDATSDEGCGPSCDAGEDVALVACPTSPPVLGTACTLSPQEECEYGGSFWLGCNQLVRCTAGIWKQTYAGQGCPQQDAGGTCPATWAEASAVDAGLGLCPAPGCQYPEGYCECLVGCGGSGAIWKPAIAGRWYCAASTPQCPSPRPDLGTSCSGAEADAGCQFGTPCGCGEQLFCVDGVWQGYALPPCP